MSIPCYDWENFVLLLTTGEGHYLLDHFSQEDWFEHWIDNGKAVPYVYHIMELTTKSFELLEHSLDKNKRLLKG